MSRRGDPPPTKTITVYRNGDAFFPGRRVVVNRRQVSSFDGLLTQLSGRLEAPFGAVRKVFSPVRGHRVQQLDALTHGGAYVAAGSERFKWLNYGEKTTKKPQNKKREQIRPVLHSRIVVSSRWRKTVDESCTINVFTNGEILTPPARVRIPKYTLRSWDSVLSTVMEKVHLRTGAVYRLCTLDGRTVCGPAQLENNQHYVAVGAETFKFLPYSQCVVPRRNLQQVTESLVPLPAVSEARDAGPEFAHNGDHQSAAAAGRTHADEAGRTKRAGQTSRNLPLLATGEGSVFTAPSGRSETAGAAEVQEERPLEVELPIDQMEAAMVEEECEDGGSSPGPCRASVYSLSAASRRDEEGEAAARHGGGGGSGSGVRSRAPHFFKEKQTKRSLR